MKRVFDKQGGGLPEYSLPACRCPSQEAAQLENAQLKNAQLEEIRYRGEQGGTLPRVLAASLRAALACPLASGGPIRETVPTGGTRCELIAWAAQLEESALGKPVWYSKKRFLVCSLHDAPSASPSQDESPCHYCAASWSYIGYNDPAA